ncbi:BTAD domain-containing putative transcriptional regulator [Catenulispora pinisilvae]|uniref:BTAD domain-containing putative transcriptional regulator n=1 Tax=Catenulispora pinisilvae TaxID=2705253 RepID=UPI00189240E7|nr:BTAD domain-containing putative transcriptional regulator [Catenulispora pinisilvae]
MVSPVAVFRILGDLAVEIGGREADPGPHKQRLVLAMLLCRANCVVSTDLLTDAVWGDDPPRTAHKNLHVYVSSLRQLLRPAGGPDRIVHRSGGYVMRVETEELDSLRFREFVRAARMSSALAGDHQGSKVPGASEHAARLLGEALDLWRGSMLADLADSPAIRAEADAWALRRVTACEDWAEAAVDVGRAAAVADRVAELIGAHPLRERLRAVQMIALHRSGRRTEALAGYDEYRRLLAAELGLDVGPVVQNLYRSLLAEGAGESDPTARTSTGISPGAGTGTGAGSGRDTVPKPRRQTWPQTWQTWPQAPQMVGGSVGGGAMSNPSAGRPRLLLPPDLHDFTGRAQHAAELAETVGVRRCSVYLCGPLGVGKTALAVRTAHRLAADFPDGCLLIRMRRSDGSPRPVTSLLADLCRVTGTAIPQVDDEDDAIALWQAEILGRSLLLVLDDVADVADASGLQPLLPGPGGSVAIVTTRRELPGIGSLHRMELGAFSPAEALDLLARHLTGPRVANERGAAERIVAAVGLLPLTVRLVGGKLAALRHLSLSAYAARLEHSGSLLDELAVGETTVRPLLGAWWQGLVPQARAGLRALSRLPGPVFTLAEASGVLGLSLDEAARALESLIEQRELDSPLAEVTAHAVLYELPLLSRLYAREQDQPEPAVASVAEVPSG